MKIHNYLLDKITKQGQAYLLLIDPDKMASDRIAGFVSHCQKSGVDGFLFGGSLLMNGDMETQIKIVKQNTTLPVILFPGSETQVTPYADAVLFLSLLSGRNAEHLIGKHVIAAPLIRKMQLEPISTGYVLIESGKRTTAEYMSGSAPIPRHKPEIAVATALAGEYLGMKYIYLEAGSGAELPVPVEMIKMVSSACSIPIIVGGGIRDAETAAAAVRAGAKIVVTGNFFEDEKSWGKIAEFADAIHSAKNESF